MRYLLEIGTEAENDISESFLWYEEQQSGLGNKFERVITDLLADIQRNPLAFQKRYKNIRIAFSQKFSFGIHFIVKENIITIIAVFHTSRNPKLWVKR
ncbi:MAG: type II toxin-antitoxin system RelE/ParE family toxin [Chitinophagales bacterium]|nr:type II toxin-antitoxin system RelE/ParE family toxin [Chitinophagales bacterium]